MKIAFFSPLNPKPTGISDYSEELLPGLAELADVDVFIDDYEPTNEYLKRCIPIYSYRKYHELATRHRYDVNLYQMGNSGHHAYIYQMLQQHPGVTVLHDIVLHHFLCEAFLARGDLKAYVREVGYSHGPRGLAAARALILGEPVSLFDYPSFHRVVDSSFGVIAHSTYAAGVIHDARPDARVARIPQVMQLPPPIDGRVVREQLGILPDQLVIGSFGRVTPAKRIDVVLRAFAKVLHQYPDAIYLIVGEITPECHLDQLVTHLGLRHSVRFIGWLPDLRSFNQHVAACDICVNLRYPTAGETSAAALRLFASGRPTIITDIDAFSELLDDCCVKVPVGPDEEAELTQHLIRLAEAPDLRKQMGERAREMIRSEHSLDQVARAYVATLKEFSSLQTPKHAEDGLNTEIGQLMKELGLTRVGFSSIWSSLDLDHAVYQALAGLALADH